MSTYCEFKSNPLVPVSDAMGTVFVVARRLAAEDIEAFNNRIPGAYESSLGYAAVHTLAAKAESESERLEIEMHDIYSRDIVWDVTRCLETIIEGRCSKYKSVEELLNE